MKRKTKATTTAIVNKGKNPNNTYAKVVLAIHLISSPSKTTIKLQINQDIPE